MKRNSNLNIIQRLLTFKVALPLGGVGSGLLFFHLLLLSSCSTTSSIPDGEQLYTGQKSTAYQTEEKNAHFYTTKEELDLVLATVPNAALFGSTTYRSPFPVGLWIWNAFSTDSTRFSRWMTRAFGSRPVLMSHVNPALHASVGKNTLQKRGYFAGQVDYEVLPQRHPKKAKVRYTVDTGHLWTLDTVSYVNFPAQADSMLEATRPVAYIQRGDAFDVSALESERARVADLFRDNGYYYYEKSMASFLADTLSVPGKVQLRLQMADSVEARATKPWTVGKITINFRRSLFDKLENTRQLRTLTINYNGKRQPLRTRTILNALQFRSRQPYSRQKVEASQVKLANTGLFSRTTFTFSPASDSLSSTLNPPSSALDLTIDCLFDKPYDFYVEAYGKGKTSGRVGPEIITGITKRNVFRGAEQLNFNVHGSYEWQTGHRGEGTKSGVNSYEYGAETSLTFPRIVNPFQVPMRKKIERARKKTGDNTAALRQRLRRRTRFYDTPSTVLSASANIINRAEYFKRHVVSGELRYNWQTSAQTSYEFSPLSLSYEYMNHLTDSFVRLEAKHPYLVASMADQFIPKMQFSYSYHSPSDYRSPISWWTTVSEASNLLSLGYMAAGKKWGEHYKTMFKNPYAQFLKLETNYTKVWRLSDGTSLAAHANAGVLWTYGNSDVAPYTEQFYAGGANSIRAFNVRSIGPGKYRPEDKQSSYVEQTGDIKLLLNLEYRPQLFGNLYGALFLDAGNVWALREDTNRPGAKFEARNFFREMALGTGIGLRYDLDYFILRLDWGVGLHVPYETTRSGFYNIDHFQDCQTFHLAIGLPF